MPVWLILSSLKGDLWSTQLDLARSLGIEGPTMTRHLDNLEQSGLVSRQRSESDRRAFRVELTEAGERGLRPHAHRRDRLQQAPAGRVLGRAELRQLDNVLKRLAGNVAAPAS